MTDEDFLAIGLWLDAVPYASDRKLSLECVAISLPGIATMRIPITGFPKHFRAGSDTLDYVCEVLDWSFKNLLNGTTMHHLIKVIAGERKGKDQL